MRTPYEQYQSEMLEKIEQCKSNFTYQPILFIGSGFSKRYLGGPNWVELLQKMAENCPNIKKDLAYYIQGKNNDLAAVASQFVGYYRTWAWTKKGREEFPNDLFSADTPEDSYLKYQVCKLFKDLVGNQSFFDSLPPNYSEELEALKAICPQAIITTNYDTFLEDKVFIEHTPIIGQKIITNIISDVGEIYKIHGCASDFSSIVLTKEDYERFNEKSKYLIAKLLTFFLEHPIIFIGYGVNDENIKSILADIDLVLGGSGELMSNMFFVKWERNFCENKSYSREHSVSLSNGKIFRMNNISVSDYKWVFSSFKNSHAIENFNPRILRSLISRQYKLVREDIPKSTVQVNYEHLSQYADADGETLVKLYGIADAATVAAMSANFPFTLTKLANRLGYKRWHKANDLIEKITSDKGISIKSSDNVYHICVSSGDSAKFHFYSEAAYQLLIKVRDGLPYELELD